MNKALHALYVYFARKLRKKKTITINNNTMRENFEAALCLVGRMVGQVAAELT